MIEKSLLRKALLASSIVASMSGLVSAQQHATKSSSRGSRPQNSLPHERTAVPNAAVATANPKVDLNAFAAALAGQMRKNPNLQGAWLYLEPDDQSDPGVATRVFRFRRVFDRSQAAIQSQEMSRIITTWLPFGNYSIDLSRDAYFPVSELLAELQYQIDLDAGLAGSMITGLYFEESKSGGGLNLVLRGRVSSERQVEQLERLCASIMKRNPNWLRAGIHPSTRNTEELSVVAPFELKAQMFFAEGLQQYWKSRHRDAASAFQRATLDSPSNLQYHYWRVLSDLTLGDRQQASTRMESIVRAFGVEPLSQDRAAISRSMERIQGPLRRELRDVEMQAALKVLRAKKVASR